MRYDGIPGNIRNDQTTEAEWQASIVEMATALGWLTYHTHDSRRSDKGYPDLTCSHPLHGVVWFECKRQAKPKITREQRDWIRTLQQSGNLAAIVRPSDADWVESVLRGTERYEPIPHKFIVPEHQ